MRKLILISLLVCTLVAALPAGYANADGGIFPLDPAVSYPEIRFHHVTVDIEGNHAVTRVDQEFYNPYAVPLEGRYMFPVPPGATVTHFDAMVDGQAQQAIRQDVAATNGALFPLVTGRRDPSLLRYVGWESLAFNLSLPPRSSSKMALEYEEVLVPNGGMFRYRYVLSTENYSAQPVRDVSLDIKLRSQSGLATVYSSSHPVTISRSEPGQASVRWQANDVLAHEDFELFFSDADSGFGAGLLVGQRAERDHLLFLFSPDGEQDAETSLHKDLVFVLDKSGSMSGDKISQAQSALGYFLNQLGQGDRFGIVAFNNERQVFGSTLRYADDGARDEAQRFARYLTAGGGTDIMSALDEALGILSRSEPREEASQLVVFLTDGLPTVGLTDGAAIAERVSGLNETIAARLHAFGVGYDVNSHLLDRLAADNGGSVTYVQPGENLEGVLTAFYNRIAHPVLTDVRIEFEGLEVQDLYPQDLPDMFAGSSLMLAGRYRPTDAGDVKVQVRGRAGEQERVFSYRFDLSEAGGHDFVARLWATRRAGELLDQVRIRGESDRLVREIRELGLAYGIITPYTGSVIAAQQNGAASAENMRLYGQQELNMASGQVTIQARVQNQAYQQAEQAGLANGANVRNLRQYSMAQLGSEPAQAVNVDLSVLQGRHDFDEPVTAEWVQRNVQIDRQVQFGSEEYLRLAEDPEARPALQSGLNVIFRHQGQVVQVLDGEGSAVIGQAPARPDRATGTALWDLAATLGNWLWDIITPR